VWHFVTKSTGLKSVKPSMSSHFPESIDPRYVNSTMGPKCPRKEWRTKSLRLQSGELSPSGYTHGKATQSLSKDQVAWLHLRLCLVPSWRGASRTIWNCRWSRGILGPPRVAASASLPKEKAGTKMNECEGLHWTFLFMKLSLFVCQKWMSYSNNLAYLKGSLRFCENELQVSDIEGKMVLTP